MSYNIDSVHVLAGPVKISVGDLREISETCEEDLPECCFVNDMMDEIDDNEPSEKVVEFDDFSWAGIGSGWSYERTLKEKIVPRILGHLEVVFVWEGGDSISGFIVDDGKITECNVSYKLVPKS